MTTVLEHAPPVETEPRPEVTTAGLPHEAYYTNGRLQIVIAGFDDKNTRDFALEAAHASLEETLAERGMRGFLKRVVHGNMLRGHFLLKKAAQARKDLEASNNFYHLQGVDASAYEQPTLRRFAKDDDTFIHEDVGEYRLRINESSKDNLEFRSQVLGLLKAHVMGNEKLQTSESFDRVVRTMLHNHRKNDQLQQYLGDSKIRANNLWQVAQNLNAMVKTAFWSQPGKEAYKEAYIDDILQRANIIIGRAHIGPHSSFNQSRLERLSRTVEGRAFINEVGAVSAVTLAYSLGGLAVQRTLGAMTAAIAPGAVAGAWAGAREGRILDDERVKHFRDQAYGQQGELTGRRKSLDRTQYEVVSAAELTHKLRSCYHADGIGLAFQTSEELMKVVRTIAECDARLSLSRTNGIDLITGTSLAQFETEREQLLYALQKARSDLFTWLDNTDAETLEHFGLHSKDIKAIKSGDPRGHQELLDSVSQRYLIEEDIKDKDKTYRSIRKRRVAAMAGVAALAGGSIGLVVQEGIAAINPHLDGLFEKRGSAHRQTYLAGLLRNDAIMQPVADSTSTDTSVIPINDKLSLTVPESLNVNIRDGKVHIAGPEDMAVSNLTYNADNTLTEESMQKLKDAGFTVTSTTSSVEAAQTTTATLTAKDFIAANPDAVTSTKVGFYYTNNTKGADGNEKLLQYGGKHGLDSNGNIILQLGEFGQHESTAGKHRINPKIAAAQGKLWLSVTASNDTQGKTFIVKANNQGQVVIDKNSPLSSLFHKSGNNTYPTFTGHKLQMVEHGGKNSKGEMILRPVASDFGTNKARFTETVTTPAPAQQVSYTLQYATPISTAATTPGHQLVNVPPIIPLYTRSTLSPGNTGTPKKEAPKPQPTKLTTENDDTSTKAPATHAPRHAKKPLPEGAHAEATSVAQNYYARIMKSTPSLRKARRQLKAILKKAGLKRKDITFSDDGKQVYVLREARIPTHVTV